MCGFHDPKRIQAFLSSFAPIHHYATKFSIRPQPPMSCRPTRWKRRSLSIGNASESRTGSIQYNCMRVLDRRPRAYGRAAAALNRGDYAKVLDEASCGYADSADAVG